MKKYRFFALLLALVLCVQAGGALVFSASAAGAATTQQDATAALLALQTEYPDGMAWTNNSPTPSYLWRFKGSIVSMGGCAAFAAILQDRVFGSITDAPVTWQRITGNCETGAIPKCAVPYSWDNLWPGDILQFPGHVVIVLEKYEDHITVAEGNSGGKVRWGRGISKDSVAAACYVLTRYKKTEPLMRYTDLPTRGQWSYTPVTWALTHGVAAPIHGTCFTPESGCSRAEMLYSLWAASGRPEPTKQTLPFTDLDPAAYYCKPVLWALEKGITKGTSATTFSPDDLCTRAQALTFLWRAEGWPKQNELSSPFEDVPSAAYYASTVSWAVENRITNGTSATTFSPDRTITRAEALAFIYRAKGA